MRMLAVLTGLFLLGAVEGGVASAASLTLTEAACGPDLGWRCYFTNPTEQFVTTFDSPHAEWNIDLAFPDDPENWSVVNIAGVFNESAAYGFIYPDSSYFGGATSLRAAFVDSTGFEFAAAERSYLPSTCNSLPDGRWACSEGDILMGGKQYGAFVYPTGGSPDPTLPPLVGPVTLSMDWSVYGDQPESSTLQVTGAWFGYALAPVPEPSTGLLTGLGFIGIALARRGNATRRVFESHRMLQS